MMSDLTEACLTVSEIDKFTDYELYPAVKKQSVFESLINFKFY